MKVLTIINSASIGGIEKTLLSCLRNITDENIQMSILCFKQGGELEDEFKELGVEFLYIKKTGLIFLDFLQLFIILIRNNFDAVHSRFGFTSGGFVLASILTKTRVFVSLHNTEPSSYQHLGKTNIFYKLYYIHLKLHKIITERLATNIIGHSKANLDVNYPKWQNDKRFKLIYNGVDFKQLDNDFTQNKILSKFVKNSDLVILHIGSFRGQKNHSFLIDCFKSLDPVKNNYKLILLGSGGLLQNMKDKVAEMKIDQNVFFAGYDKNINKYFENSDLFFLPSLNEGLANVLIEAQYKKLPICVSDIKPLYESGFKGYHKYYINPMDLITTNEKLNEIICDIKKGNLELTVKEAHEYVLNNFSIQVMLKNLTDLYYDYS